MAQPGGCGGLYWRGRANDCSGNQPAQHWLNKLESIARIDGYTNHILGSRDLDLGKIVDSDGDGIPEIIIPSINRLSLNLISFANGTAKVRKSIAATGKIISIESLAPASVGVRTELGQVSISLR